MAKKTKSITRRTFMKGAASGAGILGTTGIGWADKGLNAAQSAQSKAYSFETPPPPIPAGQIGQRIIAEVVVIGAGTSGLVCANAAAENGAKVVVIASTSGPVGRGGSNHAFNSKLMRKLGLTSAPARNSRMK